MRRYRFGRWLLAAVGFLLIAVVAALAVARGDQVANDPQAKEGHQAPDFALKSLEGKTLRFSELRGKKVVLINFWATWCPPCRLEMPTMQKIYSEYRGKGFEILAVNIEPDAKQEIREFMKELRLTFPVLLDPQMKVAREYRVFGLPVSILVDRKGIVRARETGYHDWTDKESREQVESLLK